MKRLYSTFVDKNGLRYIVVGDLHIGFEWEHIIQGISLPKNLSQNITEDLIKACKMVNATKIILLGDIEHSWSNINRNTLSKYQFFRYLKEKKQSIRYFFDTLNDLIGDENVILIRGNHDITIGTDRFPIAFNLIEEVTINKKKYSTCFSHGHKFPSDTSAKEYVFAHIHPSIQLRDPTGLSYYMPVFLYTELSRASFLSYIGQSNKVKDRLDTNEMVKIKVIPPFNEYIVERFGNPVNNMSWNSTKYRRQKKLKTSFINKIINNHATEVYLSNGTYLGHIKDLNYDI